MVYKQKVLGAINASGAEKNYKFLYIKKLMDRIDKIHDALPGESGAYKIITLRNEAISFVDKKEVKMDMIKRADALALSIEKQMKDENDGITDNTHHIEANRVAASIAVGWVLEYFDGAWGWSTRRGILIAGPFGDGRRRFLPLSLLPEDGKYLKLPDEYESKVIIVDDTTKLTHGKYIKLPDDYDTTNENNVIVELKLRQILLNNIDEKNQYEEIGDEEKAKELTTPDIPTTPEGEQPANTHNGNENST